MLRLFTAILLLTAFTAQTFQKAFIVLDYRLNTAAFAKNCENKSRPQLRCKGKCQMMKMLQEEEKKDTQNPERKLENKAEIVLSSKSFFPAFAFELIAGTRQFSTYLEKEETRMARAVFHPPSC